ncbi:HPP family protein [Acuticoccus sp. I52.16.1]|uniref:HPP family protein n=1 Tax=Acuticoccus sp. I52.16.1 TaxID=2928472 RepID=UPI001FD3B929|nr:HPP family protein [Acuticoccus sp. I52.16.1]UOM33275.1 HPP family protein [Acuticoccus sp. I52.16.1]
MNKSHTPSRSGRVAQFGRPFLPAIPGTHADERLRAAFGAGVGLLICALVTMVLRDRYGADWFLIAPLGATAVLVFAVPNSPLAQPWSAVVGNAVSALAATAVVYSLASPWAPAVAVGAAIYCMMLARALHPPGGAVALLATIEADTVREIGPLFALVPVGVTTALLVLVAVVYNRWTGRIYPFRQAAGPTVAEQRLGLSTAELQNLLTSYNQSSNVGVADLARLLAAAEREAVSHRFEGTRCVDIMSGELITVSPETPLIRAAWLFQRHAIKSLPVVDGAGRLLGIVLQANLISALTLGQPLQRSRSARRLKRPFRDLLAEDAMVEPAVPVTSRTPVGSLLNRLATQQVQVVPVIDEERLVGIITRSDIIALLLKDASHRSLASAS